MNAAQPNVSPTSTTRNTPVVLIIRDGWGHNPHLEQDSYNAVKLARTPADDMLQREWPTTLIATSGEDVGLFGTTMGNSEVGHQNIGAGRIVNQDQMRITSSIRDESFYTNDALRKAFDHAQRNHSDLHVMGLASNGRVHSDLFHLFALIDMARRLDFPPDRFFIHCFTDGRDTGPQSGLGYITEIENKLREANVGRIATVTGRYFAMDRDHRWERTAAAYAALTGRIVAHPNLEFAQPRQATSALEVVRSFYTNPMDVNRAGDEFVPPTQIVDEQFGHPLAVINDNDSVIFSNFRGDRPRQLTKAFVLDDAQWSLVDRGGFPRGNKLTNLCFVTMAAYEAGLPVDAVAFPKPPKMKNILGEYLSNLGLTQFRCAETEKFAHVTFFFNDYREDPFPGEHRELIDSPTDVTTYDQKPEMSAYGVCDAVLRRLNADDCEALIMVNFANGDMVGHTGKLDAAIRAIEVTDECVGRIIDATLSRNGSLLITADHGNAEQMRDPETGTPHTAHTNFRVPLTIVGGAFKGRTLRDDGRLADLAPTALDMMQLPKPAEMTGTSSLE